MSEYESRPARGPDGIDWRRLEVATNRFSQYINEGIAKAQAEHTEIDDPTARCIAHTLGRGLGRESCLAEFGRTGEGSYDQLREEYLVLYCSDTASPEVKELIDWLGTHLIHRDGHQNLRRFQNEHLPPKLERVLVPTGVEVGDWYLTVHVPASYNRAAIEELTATLTELQLDKDVALQAFLNLPDVNAMSGDIMQDFHDNYIGTYMSIEEAVSELAEVDELERDLHDYAEQRHLFIEQVTPDYEALREEAEGVYDIVEREGRVYVFYK
ncbi:hypothetical protein [uncultured Salinibacterium sp.]|uniref:hypothetical protein n=1 Tax=uncultured Salinibacterium sp. TaxID=459274 RepID=UPI0030D86DD2|tara:strand:+ start:131622 stop:132428 length:807 start_codon:yes stop_codon:yes gene_type:complete